MNRQYTRSDRTKVVTASITVKGANVESGSDPTSTEEANEEANAPASNGGIERRFAWLKSLEATQPRVAIRPIEGFNGRIDVGHLQSDTLSELDDSIPSASNRRAGKGAEGTNASSNRQIDPPIVLSPANPVTGCGPRIAHQALLKTSGTETPGTETPGTETPGTETSGTETSGTKFTDNDDLARVPGDLPDPIFDGHTERRIGTGNGERVTSPFAAP